MRILTYIADQADEGRAVRSVVPRRFSLGEHAYRRLKVQGGIRIGVWIPRNQSLSQTKDCPRKENICSKRKNMV